MHSGSSVLWWLLALWLTSGIFVPIFWLASIALRWRPFSRAPAFAAADQDRPN
jgi:hypothetical protein